MRHILVILVSKVTPLDGAEYMCRLLVPQCSQLKYIYSNKTYYVVLKANSDPTLRRISGR